MDKTAIKKQKKQAERRKRIERERNLKHNQPTINYFLEAKIDGKWHRAMTFPNMAAVDKHCAEIAELRVRGGGIIEARIKDRDGVTVRNIAGQDGPAVEDLPEKGG